VRSLQRARATFYRRGGPWLRRGLYEAVGSRKYSYPAIGGIDRRLIELLPHEGGTFVEAGAHDGYTQSNTYHLERFRGWSGLLVEAIPELCDKAARRRRAQVVNAALVPPADAGQPVKLHFGDLMSTMGDRMHAEGGLSNANMAGYEVAVTGRTLSSLIDDAGIGAPDLMVLDLEGRELGALQGLDLGRHAPTVLVVETLEAASNRHELDDLLATHYEFREMVSPDDALYVLRDSGATAG
jgi:FkbM family methyltransferase